MLKALPLAIWLFLALSGVLVGAKTPPYFWSCTHGKAIVTALKTLQKYDRTDKYKEVHRLCDCLEWEDEKGWRGDLRRCRKPKYLERLRRLDMVDACKCLHWKIPTSTKTSTRKATDTTRKTTTTSMKKTTLIQPTTTMKTTTTSKPATTKKTTTTSKSTATKSTTTKKTTTLSKPITTNKTTTTKKTTTSTKTATTKTTTTKNPNTSKSTTTTSKGTSATGSNTSTTSNITATSIPATSSNSTVTSSATDSSSTESATTSGNTDGTTSTTSTVIDSESETGTAATSTTPSGTTSSPVTASGTTTTSEGETSTTTADSTTTATESETTATTTGSTSSPSTTATDDPSTTPPPTVETPPGTDGFRPPLIADFKSCTFDPTGNKFEIVDAADGIVIRNENNLAIKPSTIEIWKSIDSPFTFVQAPGAPVGVFDFVYTALDGKVSYLAVLESGRVIFTPKSSWGQAFANGKDGEKFITSLFTYSCDGKLSMGIIGGAQYEFTLVENDLYARPLGSSLPGTSRKVLLYKKSGFNPDTDPTEPAPAPTSGPLKRRQYSTGGRAPRCPNNPPGLTAVDNPFRTRGPEINGCGPNNGVDVVPDLNFGRCCDAHDICFDSCNRAFEPCNSEFLSCNLRACDSSFERVWYKPWNYVAYEGCAVLADVYYIAVSTDTGVDVFKQANKEMCICKCVDSNKKLCWGTCAPNSVFQADRNNCGDCENKCADDRICKDGSCVCPEGSSTCFNKVPFTQKCYNLKTDNENCGRCSNKCPAGSSCSNGTCICDDPTLTLCSDQCVNTHSTNFRHCGSCAACDSSLFGVCDAGTCRCQPGERLCGADCINTQNDANNCGTCGKVCPGKDSVCEKGFCMAGAPLTEIAECRSHVEKKYQVMWFGSELEHAWDDLDDRWMFDYHTIAAAKTKVECCSACYLQPGGCLYYFMTQKNGKDECQVVIQNGESKLVEGKKDREICPYGGLRIKPWREGYGSTTDTSWGMAMDAELGPCAETDFEFCLEPGYCI